MPENDSLDIQDYLDATSDSSKRTRTVSFTLVVVSVLVFAGLLNSLQASWMRQRITLLNEGAKYLGGPLPEKLKKYSSLSAESLKKYNSMSKEEKEKTLESLDEEEEKKELGYYDALVSKVGPPPADSNDDGSFFNFFQSQETAEQDAYRKRYDAWYSAYVRSYAENTFYIRVPFFGFSFDINDLGVLGGVAFLVLLLLLRFCLSREVDNLSLSFAEAVKLNKLYEFYILLAMRQVLTVPRTPFIKRTNLLRFVPKLIYCLPLAIHAAVVLHDYTTLHIGIRTGERHANIIFASGIILWLLISMVTITVIKRLSSIDSIWERWWPLISSEAEAVADRADSIFEKHPPRRNFFERLHSARHRMVPRRRKPTAKVRPSTNESELK